MADSIVHQVQPFNQFALGSCFEYGYIPAFSALGGSEFAYILNLGCYFRYWHDGFCVTQFEHKTRQELEIEAGIITQITNIYDSNIIRVIIDYLLMGSLVMCKVIEAVAFDPDTMKKTQKSFTTHYILIFGFDQIKKEFDVIEHQTTVSAIYKHYKMHFADFVEAYKKGYNDKEDDLNMIVFSRSEKNNQNQNMLKQYCNRCKDMTERLTESNISLYRFMNELIDIAKTRDKLPLQFATLLTEVIKSFQREDWLQNMAGVQIDCTSALLKGLNLIRTFGIKCDIAPSERSHNALALQAESIRPYISRWYENLFNLMDSASRRII